MNLLPPGRPQRAFTVSTFVNAVGSGAYLTAGVLFFTEAVRLPATDVGFGLGAAGLASLTVGFTIGRLADRRGPRAVYAATLLLRASATASFVLVNDFWSFLVLVCIASASQVAGLAARSPIIKQYGGAAPQRFRAYLRAVTNLGISGGAVAAGWAVTAGTRSAYDLLIVGNAVAFAGSAAVLAFVPAVKPARAAAAGRWTAVRDKPYMVLALLDGLMSVQFKVLTVALPLWLINDTSAPRWLVAGIMIVNTVIVIAFQVPASQGVDSPVAGGRAYRRAGVAFLVSCAVIPISAATSMTLTVGVLVLAVVIHTVGELFHSAGNFEISFAFAPDHETGQYLGVFGMGAGLGEAVGPIALIALCINWGTPGWLVAGVTFLAVGLLVPPAVRRAGDRERLET